MVRLAMVLVASASVSGTAFAQSADELSKQLANPIANLISVPFQYNYDRGAGLQGKGNASTLNIQPVIPISLNAEWNVISRTILPVDYRDYYPGGDIFGIGDITQSLFLSPKAPGPGGLIWGVGPAILIPTATDYYLGSGKLGLGPTGVALVQKGPWTVGALANHLWSVAGSSERINVSATYMQPFLTYSFGHGLSTTLDTESTYDWIAEDWTVPINLTLQQVVKIGDQPISLQIGGRYYATTPEYGPEWGIRSSITFLFPKK